VSVDTQHHLLVVADHHGPSVGDMENHLPFALVEELLDLVLRDGTLFVEDEHLVGQDPIVEVRSNQPLLLMFLLMGMSQGQMSHWALQLGRSAV
jgi:hypothetical protein